jgi:MoxR-like ATPase
VKTSLGYPDREGERELLRRRLGRAEQVPDAEQVLTPERVRELQTVPESVHVDEDLQGYVTDVARATREDARVEVGVSPRGTQRLLEVARANAVVAGRDYLTPDDVKRVARPALAHRLVLTPEATVENVAATEVVETVLDDITVPTVE